MSKHPGEELPLTAEAFAQPAASRRNVTTRLVPTPKHAPKPGGKMPITDSGVAPPAEPVTSRSPVPSPSSAPSPTVPSGPQPPAQPPTSRPPTDTAVETERPNGYGRFAAAAAAASRQGAPNSPAEWGWRGRIRRMTGGRVSPAAGWEEAVHRAAIVQVQHAFAGPRTITFVNPKGGASTTTSTLMAARTFGVHRGAQVVAWDNNETRGTLGERAMTGDHTNTARELLQNIHLFEDNAHVGYGDLGMYVRGQGPAFFDVLASDDRAEVTGHIDAADVVRLHRLFSRSYKMILIDTGNNLRAANFLTAVRISDLLVVTTTIRQDSAQAAMWMLDSLERDVFGPGQLRHRALTVMAEPAERYDPTLRSVIVNHFRGRTRGVFSIPFDPALVDGGVINYERISRRSHRAWLFACAGMATAL